MTRPLISAFFIAVLASSISGCQSQQEKQVEQDAKFRQQVEELKKKSHAYPMYGSQNNKYIP